MIVTKPTVADILMQTQAFKCQDQAAQVYAEIQKGANVLGLDRNAALEGKAVLVFATDDGLKHIDVNGVLHFASHIRKPHVERHIEDILIAVEDCDLSVRKAVAAAVRKLK